MIEFSIDNDGSEIKTDLSNAAEFLKSRGLPITNIAQDGLTAYLQMPDGQLQPANISDLLQEQGLTVTGLRPIQASSEQFDPKFRFLTERLSNDAQKQQLLTMELQQKGIQNPTVIGAGEDWYAFDPKAGQYFALTNKPGLDLGDIEQGAEMVGKGIASTLGGVAGATMGAPLGPGAIATGAAGAAGGAGLAEEGLQALAAGISPAFREVQNLRGALTKGGVEAAFAAPFGALGGVGAWGAKALPKLAEEGLANSFKARALSAGSRINDFVGMGAVSPTLRGAGTFAEATGGMVSGTAGAIADSPVARTLATSFMPVLGDVNMAGFLLQAPRAVNEMAARAPGWLARKMGYLEKVNPDFGAFLPGQEVRQGMENWSKEILTRRKPDTLLAKTEEALARGNMRARGMPAEQVEARMSEPRAQDIFGNIVEHVASKFRKQPLSEEVVSKPMAAGRFLGRGMDTMYQVGKGLERGSEEVMGGLLRGAQAAGKATELTGRTARMLGTVTQPFEGRVAGRFGEEEMADWLENKLRSRQRRASSVGIQDQILASY